MIPTVLVIDFYDSYTRNVLSLFSKTGLEWQDRVVIVNVDSLTWESFVKDILPFIGCIILGPGPGSPHKTEDFSWPIRLIQEFGDILPIFGLCLGHQGLATAFGASIVKAPSLHHGQISSIQHGGDSLFDGIDSAFAMVQYNSLVVEGTRQERKSLPKELEIIGWCQDGTQESIMAIKHQTKPLWGVQFHPEGSQSIASTNGVRLLTNFLSLAESYTTRLADPTASLPPHILSLSTSVRPKTLPPPLISSDIPHYEIIVIELPHSSHSPEAIFESFVKGISPLGEIWLDSARPTVSPQFSHLCNPTFTLSFSQPNNTLTTITSTDTITSQLAHTTSFIEILASIQSEIKSSTIIPENPLTFPLGFIGYLGYEMKESTLPLAGPTRNSELGGVKSEFAFVDKIISFEHATGIWRIAGLVKRSSCGSSKLKKKLECKFGISEEDWSFWSKNVMAQFNESLSPIIDNSPSTDSITFDSLTSDLNSVEYCQAVESAKATISAGDAYELCLTTQFRTNLSPVLAADPFPLYKKLRISNPAPYSAYFKLPQSNLTILSSSPERFMRISREGAVEMKPIKGTIRRSDDPIEDEKRKLALEADEKERAENLMIVDLCRNDLLGFCDVKSVQVPRLMIVETYETVHQLVTSIVGDLLPGITPFEAVAGAFPPGSMTGAPKMRSVQVLETLERGTVRDVYAGAFGYVAIDGTTDFSVVIRTMVIRGDELTLGGGGAITHLSNPESEWEEALLKIDAVVGNRK